MGCHSVSRVRSRVCLVGRSGAPRWLAAVMLALWLWGFVLGAAWAGGTERKPNVVWILLDACRPQLACYGYDRPTSPNIDALAARGVLFEQHFAQADQTVYSVPSYMSGRRFALPCIGVYGAFEAYRNLRLPTDGERLAPEIFKENGYETVMITQGGVWFSLQDRLPRAFDRFIGVKPARPPLVTLEELNAVVFAYLDVCREAPFFLYLHTWDTHFPHYPEPPYDRWIGRDYDADVLAQSNVYGVRKRDGSPFNARDKEYIRGLYDGSILYADAHVGAILDKLENQGLIDNTVVLITSDHGEALGEDGKTIAHGDGKTYDEVTRVPCIMAGPGLPKGGRVRHLTENADIVPTLVQLLGLESDAVMEGHSLVPVIRDPSAQAPHQCVFTRTAKPGHYDQVVLSLRNERFRYEYNTATGEEHLYPVPDLVATRHDVLQARRNEAEVLKRIMLSDIVPRWEARAGLPLMAVYLDMDHLLRDTERSLSAVVKAGANQSPDAFGQTDGKWLLHDKQLFAASFAEDVPALALRGAAPDGRYRVMMELYCDGTYAGKPASSLAVRVEGSPEFVSVSCGPTDGAEPGYVFVEVGEYDVGGGYVDLLVDDGDPSRWTAFKSCALVVPSPEAQAAFAHLFEGGPSTQLGFSQRLEQLRALGYFE